MDVGVFTTLPSWSTSEAPVATLYSIDYASVTMYTVCKIIFSYGPPHEEILPNTFSHNHLHDTLHHLQTSG